MREYLKKLGKTKFQAYLVVTIVNIITFILYLKGYLKVDDQVNEWMPAINLGVQMIATAVYTWVEGSIDRAGVTPATPVDGTVSPPADNSGADKSH